MSHAIYIVEDHPVMREMLREFLEMTPEFSVVGEAETAEKALEAIPEMDLDIVLIDVSLPGMSGISLGKEMTKRWPDLPCLMFSAHEEASYARESIVAGARGYVVKGDPKELTKAVKDVLNGGFYVSAPLKRRLAGSLRDLHRSRI